MKVSLIMSQHEPQTMIPIRMRVTRVIVKDTPIVFET
jgi:hypothetical protein